MMGDTFIDGIDRWNIPDDRQLALRGRLETGWSSYRGNTFSHSISSFITEDEQELVLSVLQRKEEINLQEQLRIGKLVKKLEHMKTNILGDGLTTCLICGTKAGLLKDSLHYCGKCGKMVCSKCSIEVRPPHDGFGKCYLCVLCYEDKMLWKRSGAWFYNTLPKYIVPENNSNDSGLVVQGDHTPYNSSAMVPSMRCGSWADIQRNQDSWDDYSDDSDIESNATKAFDIPDDRSMAFHYINFDEDSRSIKSSGRGSPNSHEKKPSIAFSSIDEVDGENKENHYSRQVSMNSYTDSKSSPDLKDRESFDQSSLSSSDSNIKNSRLGMRGVWRKKSREEQRDTNGTNSPNLKVNGHDDKQSLNHSVSSANSEQDIDAIFKSYEGDKPGPGEKEYYGQFGMIKFTLQYDPNTQELLVIIDSCKGLKIGEKGNIPSPYVKTLILPISPEAAKASKKRTPTHKKVSDPVFNFSILYPGISDTDIENKGIRLSVMDEASFGNDTTIGETCIPLKNLATRPVQQFRRILDSRASDETLFWDSKNPIANPGRIELALHYLSKQQKLVVGIIRCVGLKALDPNGYSDPYVKCYLLPDPSKKTKRKTIVKKKTLNPEFNQEFQYEIAHSELAKKTLLVTVWDHDVGRSNDFIGGLTLGIDSTGDVLRHWFETLKTADRRVIRWHNLCENCPIVNE